MTRTAMSLLVLLTGMSWTGVAAQDATAARLLASTPQPAYPSAAIRAGVEGTVEFRASVNAEGTVDSIDIVSVPAPDVGFEESAREAVRQWRFTPATRAGAAVASMYTGSIGFQLMIPGEWIYPASSHDVWGQVRELVRALKLSTDRVEDDHQLLITRMVNYPAALPDARALGLRQGQLPDAIQFHLYVTPGMEPARVAIGSIIRTRSLVNRRETFLVYANAPASNWLLAELTRRVGKTPEALSGKAARRAEQSQRLMPPGLSDPCSSREAALSQGTPGEGVRTASALSEVKPIYPRNELDDSRQATVIFSGEVTEHGTLTNVLHVAPPDASDSFKLASQLAGSLWRFAPAQKDGCGARMKATFEMQFVIK